MVVNPIMTFNDQGDPASLGGPLGDLNQPDFTYNLYQFPSAQDPATVGYHQIIFFINIPQESFWNNSSVTNSNAPAPIANRLGQASNFALRNDTVGTPSQEIGTGNLNTSLAQAVLQSRTTRTTSAIGLYIPPTLMFTQSMQYENVSLADAVGIYGDAVGAVGLLQGGHLQAGITTLLGSVPDLAKALGGTHIPALQGLRSAGLQAAGIADNPMNFLMFKQIDFRHFSFSFILTPENATDTNVINQIIKLFRFHSAPEVLAGTTGRFFVPPSQFDIQVMYKGQLNPNIPQINTCVCNSVSVNYAEGGKWVTYTDGQPVMIKLDLEFTEMNILTKDLVNAGM